MIVINGQEIIVHTNKSYSEGDTIKVLHSKNYPSKALPLDQIIAGEYNEMFAFNEDTGWKFAPDYEGFSV